MKVFDNTQGSSQDKIMHNLLQKKIFHATSP